LRRKAVLEQADVGAVEETVARERVEAADIRLLTGEREGQKEKNTESDSD
jgi:hypothetical protein